MYFKEHSYFALNDHQASLSSSKPWNYLAQILITQNNLNGNYTKLVSFHSDINLETWANAPLNPMF